MTLSLGLIEASTLFRLFGLIHTVNGSCLKTPPQVKFSHITKKKGANSILQELYLDLSYFNISSVKTWEEALTRAAKDYDDNQSMV